ncbi:MAG: type II toxin-antitoxin system VapC family toxin [bacterium]|nr:type II toxin-antitoxin system VapC family toxin [bacterium]MCY4102935.1 type II toxin-antitoxin system VapC family toxin [bacterium]
MRVLIDTCVFLWMRMAPDRLAPKVRETLVDRGNDVLFSAVSSWEIAIKYTVGRLALPEEPDVFVSERIASSGLTPLAVEHSHALRVASLPMHHRDPFDRLLIAQAVELQVPVITDDRQFDLYGIDVISAVPRPVA